MAPEARVLTVSSSVATGAAEDRSGPAVAERLESLGFEVSRRVAVPDGDEAVAEALRSLTDGLAGLVVTVGGTGFSPDDRTPEATRAVLDREAPGFAEAIRAASSLGPLSRGVAGTRGRALILNLPGSTRGALESIDAVAPLVPHALELLAGGRPHPQGGSAP